MKQISQATILVVDRDVESLLSIASTLVTQNHRVVNAQDAESAVAIANHEPLDLLITDIRLGSWSGLELLDVIRQQPEKIDLPVMFVSAHQTPGVIRRRHPSGDAFHLKKPIDADVLAELVDRALWMPHLIRNHIEQETVKQPHFTIAPTTTSDAFGASSIFPGTPITF